MLACRQGLPGHAVLQEEKQRLCEVLLSLWTSERQTLTGLQIPTLPLESGEVKIFLVWFCYAVRKTSKHQPFILSSHLGGHRVLMDLLGLRVPELWGTGQMSVPGTRRSLRRSLPCAKVPPASQAFFRGRSHSGHTPSRQRFLRTGQFSLGSRWQSSEYLDEQLALQLAHPRRTP